jgi:hypothetical protein
MTQPLKRKALIRLIKFLALAYNENDPMFMFNDRYGHELVPNKELAETWFRVVRDYDDEQIALMLHPQILSTEQATGESPRPQEER